MHIEAEALAYWYLRLNGFLTTVNFVVHADHGPQQETDVDILGVRFPFRMENLQRPMEDSRRFANAQVKPLIAIAEVKAKRCQLNGPWTKPDRRNMQRILGAIGVFPEQGLEAVARQLYGVGWFESDQLRVVLMCFGNEASDEVKGRCPDVPQILWPEVLSFIYQRFENYRREKVAHDQWDDNGKALWDAFEDSRTEPQFLAEVRVE